MKRIEVDVLTAVRSRKLVNLTCMNVFGGYLLVR